MHTFFSGVLEGSGFGIGEAAMFVVLVGVAAYFGMKKEAFFEHLGERLSKPFRRRAAQNALEGRRPPRWIGKGIRFAIWSLIVAVTAGLAWKAFISTSPPIVQGFTQEQVNQKIAEATNGLQLSSSKVTAPQWVQNVALKDDSQTPLDVSFTITAPMGRLRVAVDLFQSAPGTFQFYSAGQPHRVTEIGDYNSPLKNKLNEATVVTKRMDGNLAHWYWANSRQGITLPSFARIVFVGPDNREQYYYFTLIPGSDQNSFDVIDNAPLRSIADWITQ